VGDHPAHLPQKGEGRGREGTLVRREQSVTLVHDQSESFWLSDNESFFVEIAGGLVMGCSDI